MAGEKQLVEQALSDGKGVLRLEPAWVPRSFIVRFGEMTHDELFVTASAAREGILIANQSPTDTLVMLKHFARARKFEEIPDA